MSARVPEELAGLREAEDFFEALGVRFEPALLDAHRLQVMKLYALALEAWLAANPEADAGARRRAMARALREAHDAFQGERAPPCNPFAPGLVTLRRR
jgi:hypothetical protein